MNNKFMGNIDINKTSFKVDLDNFIEVEIVTKYDIKKRTFRLRTMKELNSVSRNYQANKFYNNLPSYIKKYYPSKELKESISKYIDYMIPRIYENLKK